MMHYAKDGTRWVAIQAQIAFLKVIEAEEQRVLQELYSQVEELKGACQLEADVAALFKVEARPGEGAAGGLCPELVLVRAAELLAGALETWRVNRVIGLHAVEDVGASVEAYCARLAEELRAGTRSPESEARLRWELIWRSMANPRAVVDPNLDAFCATYGSSLSELDRTPAGRQFLTILLAITLVLWWKLRSWAAKDYLVERIVVKVSDRIGQEIERLLRVLCGRTLKPDEVGPCRDQIRQGFHALAEEYNRQSTFADSWVLGFALLTMIDWLRSPPQSRSHLVWALKPITEGLDKEQDEEWGWIKRSLKAEGVLKAEGDGRVVRHSGTNPLRGSGQKPEKKTLSEVRRLLRDLRKEEERIAKALGYRKCKLTKAALEENLKKLAGWQIKGKTYTAIAGSKEGANRARECVQRTAKVLIGPHYKKWIREGQPGARSDGNR
jgi:hypothetical protein